MAFSLWDPGENGLPDPSCLWPVMSVFARPSGYRCAEHSALRTSCRREATATLACMRCLCSADCTEGNTLVHLLWIRKFDEVRGV